MAKSLRFQYYEEVCIANPQAEKSEFSGDRGVVIGVGDEPGQAVSYGVLVYRTDRVVCFDEEELLSTGRHRRREDFYGDQPSLRVRVDKQGRGTAC